MIGKTQGNMEPSVLALIIVDILIILTIISTNLFAIVLILKKSKKNSKNILLVSLSVSDIAVALFVIPNVIFLKLQNSSISPILCQICLYTEYMASAANVFSISVLAVDRFRALVFPLQNKDAKREVLYGALVLIWIASLVYAVRAPVVYRGRMFQSSVNGNATTEKYGCSIPDHLMGLHSGLIVLDFIVLFAMPALVLIGCNVKVSLQLSTKSTITSAMPESVSKRRRRAVRTLLIMILIFIVFNFPLHYFRMARHVFKQSVSGASTIGHIFLILTFINNCLNVFFYGLLNEDMKSICRTCSCTKRNQVHAISSGDSKMTKSGATNITVAPSV